jgi:hypothetical protein
MNSNLKHTIIPIIIAFYSAVSIIFIVATVFTKVYNNEFLIPLCVKIILLWSEFIFLLVSIIYYITLIWFKELYNTRILLVFILNNIVMCLLFFFDIFSLFSFFLG